jgi:2-dehydro-3-deoxyphosphogluconate aldolase/(4S)-4-hydroxy-2-oxoglutarate aldolase
LKLARYRRLETLMSMKRIGVIPVFYEADPATAREIVGALFEGGAKVVEFTNRGDHALSVFQELERWCSKHRPEVILGAGSIIDAPTAAMYIAAGANFIVGPLLDTDTAKLCNGRKIPYCPGCGTISEIHQAHLLGVEICKLFPGDSLGGPEFVKALLGPCPWADVMPTGGVSPSRESLASWFNAGIACAGMGSNLIDRAAVARGDFAALTAKVAEVVGTIREIRDSRA